MVVNTIKFFSKNFQESEFKFPVEKNSLVFDRQHGYHGVACNQQESSLRSMAVLSIRAQERRSREIRARSARERAAKPREK